MRYITTQATQRTILALIRRIHLSRSTGQLEVGDGRSRKRLHFIAGELYLARAHPLANQLVRYLEQAERAEPPPFAGGEVGDDDAAQIRRIPKDLGDLIHRIAEHLTGWRARSARFTDRLVQPAARLVGPLPTELLLIEAAALNCDEAELLERLGGAQAAIAATPATDDPEHSDQVGADEAYLLSRLRRPAVVGELLEALGEPRRRWVEALARLWVVDRLQTVALGKRPAGKRPAPPAADRARPRPPAPERKARPAAPAALTPAATARGAPPPAVSRPGRTLEPERATPETTEPRAPNAAIWRDHFRLTGEPFALTPDPALLFLTDGHAEALARLELGLLEHRGLVVLIGEAGTGKTAIVYALLSALDPSIETAYIANASLSFIEILQSALRDFGVRWDRTDRFDLLEALNGFLVRCDRAGKTAALVIDEAQNLTDETLEELRLLLNFETGTNKMLQIVLVGQPELGATLATPRQRQIADRIAVRRRLDRLTARQARGYVEHRLAAVGGSSSLFTDRALALVVRRSRRIPRLINILCHNAMLYAYGRGLPRVTRALVREAARELEGGRAPASHAGR